MRKITNPPPAKLYHYTSAEERTINNLEKQLIYFSQPCHFNDIFDSRVYKNAKLNDKDWKEICKIIGCQYSGNLNKANQISERIKHALEDISKKSGIFCMSEVADNLLMWGHYAKSYSGLCLEFETRLSPFEKAKKVTYSAEFPLVSQLKQIKEKASENSENMKIFLTKAKCWDYEKEWRIFHHSFGEIKYNSASLTGIYFGPKIEIEKRESIISLMKTTNPNLQFYIGRISDKKYEILFDYV
mgnify:CR=1 FL=1